MKGKKKRFSSLAVIVAILSPMTPRSQRKRVNAGLFTEWAVQQYKRLKRLFFKNITERFCKVNRNTAPTLVHDSDRL